MDDVFLLRIFANKEKIGHPVKNTWFHPEIDFQTMFTEMNDNLDAPATSGMSNTRKTIFKHKLFRGDPREFIG